MHRFTVNILRCKALILYCRLQLCGKAVYSLNFYEKTFHKNVFRL
ncbi:hypothetical protein HMPREF1548_01493 [Clostridium sp. KLE 1755]|nr:hypothetical protein HMPREF1548_01493 [Clostridium sp. KLE 1755]